MEVQQRPDPERAAEPGVQDPKNSPLSRPTLTTLPHELQLEIISRLPYPDALSLKLTSHHFGALVADSLTVLARVSWLLDRAQLDLPIPKSGALQLCNDVLFVRNAEVQKILRARRRHEECADAWRGLPHSGKWPGCLVVPGVDVCDGGVVMLRAKGIERPKWNANEMRYVLVRSMRNPSLWRTPAGWPHGAAGTIWKLVWAEMWRVLQLEYLRCDIFVLHVVAALLVIGVAIMLM